MKEVLNTIWRDYYVRRAISLDTAMRLQQVLSSMIGINVLVEPEEKYISRKFEIAVKTGMAVHDILYMALAVEKNALVNTANTDASTTLTILPHRGNRGTPRRL